MFDIGFWELTVIAVMGLVVLGPERLPTALRTVVQWVRSVRSVANNVKQDISQELRLHELHENLKKAEQKGLKDLSPELQESLDKLQSAAQSVQKPYQSAISDLNQEVRGSAAHTENSLSREASVSPEQTGGSELSGHQGEGVKRD